MYSNIEITVAIILLIVLILANHLMINVLKKELKELKQDVSLQGSKNNFKTELEKLKRNVLLQESAIHRFEDRMDETCINISNRFKDITCHCSKKNCANNSSGKKGKHVNKNCLIN